MDISDRIAVWHRRDLRTADNAALAAATADGTACPVFILDPAFYDDRGLACDSRIEFLFECLSDLGERYREHGSELSLLFGDPCDRLRSLLNEGTVDAVYFNREVTHGRGRDRDGTVAAWPETTAFGDDGIVRDRRDTRAEWATQCEQYFTADQHPEPGSMEPNPIASECTLTDVRDHYDINATKHDVPRGGTDAGSARLDRFVDVIDEYPGSISPPERAERGCSRLSPYLKFGALSLRQVYQRVSEDAIDGRGRSMFESRLYWNRHYTQKLADWPGWTDRSLNPVFRNLHRNNHDAELDRAWREGQTGFPIVDAAMRALVQTGWLSFRMRSLVATFYSYVLKQWWKPGADFLYYHLIDADPAINYTQWQSQAGLVGVHPIRVYNPRTQTAEYDPDGAYIKRYVPELEPLPAQYLARPEKMPLSVQADCGVTIGETYPYPVVDYEAEATAARELFDRLHDRAQEALKTDPTLRRRASLSRRGQRDRDGRDDAGSRDDAGGRSDRQRRLDDF